MTEKEIQFFNKNFRFTWMPIREKIKPYLVERKRSTVTFQKLAELIGEKRATFIGNHLKVMKKDSIRYKVQNKGTLDIYCK